MDVAFLAILFMTGLAGLLLLPLRETPAMGILLAVHLGVVFSLILTMPCGKFHARSLPFPGPGEARQGEEPTARWLN